MTKRGHRSRRPALTIQWLRLVVKARLGIQELPAIGTVDEQAGCHMLKVEAGLPVAYAVTRELPFGMKGTVAIVGEVWSRPMVLSCDQPLVAAILMPLYSPA